MVPSFVPVPPADIENIRVRFATYRSADVEERVSRSAEFGRIRADERVLIDTCHRVELITVDEEPAAGSVVSGRDAVSRVFEVVAGFDSAVVAEQQLLGQVRAAYESALAAGSTGPILNELLRRALRFGRRVRSHALPGADRSLADRGCSWLLERIPANSDVVVAGSGEMGMRSASQLSAAGHRVTVVSRSSERAARMVRSLPGEGHAVRITSSDLDADAIAAVAAIVLAVRTRHPLITASTLAGGCRPQVLDLSVPSAVSADAARLLGGHLVSIDQLAAVDGARPVLDPKVEQRLRRELEQQVDDFVAWVSIHGASDAITLLHGEADSLRRRHLDRLRDRVELAPEQVEAVEAASAAMLRELLHRPSVALRRGTADADTVRRLFGLSGHR